MAMHLVQPGSSSWFPPVLTCSAVTTDGLSSIWQTVLDHREKLTATGELVAKRKDQALQWMWSLIHEGLKIRFYRHTGVQRELKDTIDKVQQGEMAPTSAAQELLFLLDNE